MKKFIIFFVLLAAVSFIPDQAKAYPNYIGHGYTSCINCHYNPFGAGPLTDYGRAVSATTISSRHFFPDSMTDERLANSSGFFFNRPDFSWVRAQLNYRGFQLVKNPNSSTEHKQWINMQADARLILKYGENNNVFAVGNFGYAPPSRTNKDPKDQWRSREHYLGVRVNSNLGIYAGLMDKVFGIRVVEHIAYSRTTPQVAQNDQTYAIATHLNYGTWEGGIQYFIGNLLQDEKLRMKGVSMTAEKTVFEIHRLGFSAMKQKNFYADATSLALHGRFNLKEGSAILAEIGQSNYKGVSSSYDKTSRYALLQTYLRPTRGVYVLNNIEYFKNNIKQDDYSVRWGPGVQYFPFQRLELRLDLYNTRNFSEDSSTKDNWTYLFQTHVWL